MLLLSESHMFIENHVCSSECTKQYTQSVCGKDAQESRVSGESPAETHRVGVITYSQMKFSEPEHDNHQIWIWMVCWNQASGVGQCCGQRQLGRRTGRIAWIPTLQRMKFSQIIEGQQKRVTINQWKPVVLNSSWKWILHICKGKARRERETKKREIKTGGWHTWLVSFSPSGSGQIDVPNNYVTHKYLY